MAVVLGSGSGEQKAACERIGRQLLAFGVPLATTDLLSKSIVAESQKQPQEQPFTVNVFRGMTGRVFCAVQCKPQTTIFKVKQDIFVKTGIPIDTQQLLGFGTSHVLEDEILISAVPKLTDCGGLQIIVGCEQGCDQEVHEPWEPSSEDESSDELSLSLAKHGDFDSMGSGRDKASPMGSRGLAGRPVARPSGRPADERSRSGSIAAPGPLLSAVARGGGCAWPRGTGGTNTGRCKGRGRGSSEAGGSTAKLQKHFLLDNALQDVDFHVLHRAKCRTKNIWQQTGVSLRLHGPGSGQQEDEDHLVLSLSAKNTCDRRVFDEAVRQAQDLIISLNEQYCAFCGKRCRPVPDLELRTERGYRKGSHKKQ
jgi:hypothetical protein